MIAVAGLTVLAAVLRFQGLGHQGFWFDEGNTALLVRFSPGGMLSLIPRSESTPPLYYCLAWVWVRVFGSTEAGLRSLSAVAGVLTVPVTYAAGARLLSRRAGVIAAALTACSPLLIWYSQEARSYSLLVLFCAGSLLGFAYALAAPTARALTLWAAASALALLTHYYAVLVIAPEAAWLLYRHRRHRGVLIAVGAVALCGLALIPLAVAQNGTRHDVWIRYTPLGLRLRQVVPLFLIGTGAPARVLLKFLAFALAATALVLLFTRTRRRERGPALVAGSIALSGFVLASIFVLAGSDSLIARNLLPLWLPASLAITGGLAASRARRLGAALTAGLCAIGITAAVGIAVDSSLQRPDWRPVARMLGRWPVGAPARAILIQHYRTLLPLSLYLPHLQFMPARGVSGVRELDVIAMSSPQQPLCWWGSACNLIPSSMQAGYDIPGFHPVWRRQVEQFTILRLVAAHPVRLSPAMVSRVLVATRLRRDDLLVQS